MNTLLKRPLGWSHQGGIVSSRMSVVGIDFGNDTCYISVARQGGIETIANDYSLRSTPSYVAFGEKARTMGVAAKSAQNTQARRTFYGFKKLLGRKVGDPRVTEEMARVPFELTQGEGAQSTSCFWAALPGVWPRTPAPSPSPSRSSSTSS